MKKVLSFLLSFLLAFEMIQTGMKAEELEPAESTDVYEKVTEENLEEKETVPADDEITVEEDSGENIFSSDEADKLREIDQITVSEETDATERVITDVDINGINEATAESDTDANESEDISVLNEDNNAAETEENKEGTLEIDSSLSEETADDNETIYEDISEPSKISEVYEEAEEDLMLVTDTEAPVLKSMTLDKTTVNAPGKVLVTITASDAISGIKYGWIHYRIDGENSSTSAGLQNYYYDASGKEVRDTTGTKYYYQFDFGEYTGNKKYVIYGIRLDDNAENSVTYGTNADNKPFPKGTNNTFLVSNSGITVTSVSLNKTSATMAEGDSLALTATVSPSNATDKTVTWKSSNTGVATVSSDGTVKAVSEGKATITATAGGKSASCTITVNKKIIEVTSVELSSYAVNVTAGETVTVTAAVKPDNAPNKVVRWSSSDASVATVNNGEIRGVKEGTAVITATTASGLKTAECTVTVEKKEIPLEAVTFGGTKFRVMPGGKITLVYGYTPVNTTERDLEFSSEDESIATVDNNGTVIGKEAGRTKITVKSKDGRITAECEIEVSEEKNGLLNEEDGGWRLYKEGEVNKTYTGLYPYGTSLFYMNEGVLDRTYEGIAYYQKAPYYVKNGQVTYTYTGLGEYKGSLHYFTNSVKDESFNGIAYYKGEPYFVVNGKVTYNYVGLGEYKGSLHYFTKSRKDPTYTGISYYQGQPYYVLNGVVSYKYNGLGQYKEDWWYVVNSMVDKSYTGNYTWKSKAYTIKNGKVVN